MCIGVVASCSCRSFVWSRLALRFAVCGRRVSSCELADCVCVLTGYGDEARERMAHTCDDGDGASVCESVRVTAVPDATVRTLSFARKGRA
eukprot:1767427-Prymnesium_polylepis.1